MDIAEDRLISLKLLTVRWWGWSVHNRAERLHSWFLIISMKLLTVGSDGFAAETCEERLHRWQCIMSMKLILRVTVNGTQRIVVLSWLTLIHNWKFGIS